jgi:DNA-binding GntR family transcriptional regulator
LLKVSEYFRRYEFTRHSRIFTTIDTRSLVDKVEMNLIDFFIKKEYKPGDTIPKEMELAKRWELAGR